MKKSELKSSIKEEIIEILEAASAEDLAAAREEAEKLNKELEKTKELQDGLIDEAKEYKAGDTVKLKTGETVKINQVVQGPQPKNNTYRAKVKGKQVDFGLNDISEGKLSEDEEPTKAQLKGASKDSVATIANKLQQTTKEMKSTVNKWKRSEGEEKQKLRDKLLKLTNIKKELESML